MAVVLLVEDHAGVRELLRRLLVPFHTVIEAQNEVDACGLLARYPVDVVVLDLELAGDRRLVLCQQIRAHQRLRRIGVILLTGAVTEQMLTDPDFDMVLEKPSGVLLLRLAVNLLA